MLWSAHAHVGILVLMFPMDQSPSGVHWKVIRPGSTATPTEFGDHIRPIKPHQPCHAHVPRTARREKPPVTVGGASAEASVEVPAAGSSRMELYGIRCSHRTGTGSVRLDPT